MRQSEELERGFSAELPFENSKLETVFATSPLFSTFRYTELLFFF